MIHNTTNAFQSQYLNRQVQTHGAACACAPCGVRFGKSNQAEGLTSSQFEQFHQGLQPGGLPSEGDILDALGLTPKALGLPDIQFQQSDTPADASEKFNTGKKAAQTAIQELLQQIDPASETAYDAREALIRSNQGQQYGNQVARRLNQLG